MKITVTVMQLWLCIMFYVGLGTAIFNTDSTIHDDITASTLTTVAVKKLLTHGSNLTVNQIKHIEVYIAVLLPNDNTKLFSMSKMEPAVEIATDRLSKVFFKDSRVSFNVTYLDSNCSEQYAMNEAFELYMKLRTIHLFLGPVCDLAVSPVAKQSLFWNIPMVTVGAVDDNFILTKNKDYPLLTRAGPFTLKNMYEFFRKLLAQFSWRNVKIVNDRFADLGIFKYLSHQIGKSLYENLYYTQTLSVQRYELEDKDTKYNKLFLEEIGDLFSVVVLCASADSVREILIKAHELNFDNGEYVFLNIDLFSSKNESEKPWYRANESTERNEKAKKAYEALMTVTLRKPTSKEYKNFSMAVKQRAKYKNITFTYGEEEVNSFVGAFHDAVILYALALNETLAANKSIKDGAEITRRMWNRTFDGITGTVSIDDNGDRNADYSLLDMNPITHKFEVVANYFGKDKEYKAVPGKHINWAGGRTSAPPDTPKCGFDKSKCPPDKPFPEYGIVIIVLGSLLVLVLVAAFFIYRHIKLEAELAEMNWRVKWEDIMFGTMENDKKLRRQGSTLSLTRTNGEPCSEGRVLIERSDTVDQSWCKCGQCEESDRRCRVCCRQLELFGIFNEGTNCITTTEDFRNVVLNKEVLVAVYIHVMLVRRQRGAAPLGLSACKFRLMATRQFLCWMHRGQKLKKESRMTIPSCVARAIHVQFPDEVSEMSSTSRGSCTTTTLAELMPLDVQT